MTKAPTPHDVLAREDTALVDRKLRRRHADLLFAVRLRRGRSRVYLLPEHLSSGDPFTVLKTMGYGLNRQGPGRDAAAPAAAQVRPVAR